MHGISATLRVGICMTMIESNWKYIMRGATIVDNVTQTVTGTPQHERQTVSGPPCYRDCTPDGLVVSSSHVTAAQLPTGSEFRVAIAALMMVNKLWMSEWNRSLIELCHDLTITTLLQQLHKYNLVRVVREQNGVRVSCWYRLPYLSLPSFKLVSANLFSSVTRSIDFRILHRC
jgi:hypothetical protein